MIRTLLTGQLYGDPQARTSKTGSTFATAKVKADGKDGTVLWISIVAFNEVADRLLTLKANNAEASWRYRPIPTNKVNRLLACR